MGLYFQGLVDTVYITAFILSHREMSYEKVTYINIKH